MEEELRSIKEKLAAIEALLQRLPEIQAGVFFSMLDEYQAGKVCGLKASELWEIPDPTER